MVKHSKETREKISKTRRERIKNGKINIRTGARASHFRGGEIRHGFSYIRDENFPLRDKRKYCKLCNLVWFQNTGQIINPKTEVIVHKDGNKLNDNFQNLKIVTKEEYNKMRYQAVSETLKEHHKRNPMKMKTRIKIADKLRGKSYLTDEGRKRLSIASKGKIYSSEAREKMSQVQQRLIKEGKKKILFGKDNPAWKGGKFFRASTGYHYVHVPGFPAVDKKGYVKRANWIWYMNTGETIRHPFFLHHINGNKEDDRIENLKKMENKKEHMKIHREEINKTLSIPQQEQVGMDANAND